MFENINILSSLRNWFSSGRNGGLFFNYMLGQKGAIWLDVNNPYELYNSIPQYKIALDRRVSMHSNMVIKQVDSKTGEELQSPHEDLQALLAAPNPLQGMNEWLTEWETQLQVYGNSFMYLNKPSRISKVPVTLMNVSPRYMQPVLTGKYFDQVRIEDIIKEFKFIDLNGVSRSFDPKTILYSKITGIDNAILGVPPVEALCFPLTNIKLAYGYMNVSMKEGGAIGMLGPDSKDSMGGTIPLKPSERLALEKQYTKDYGIGPDQAKVKISEVALKWQAMTFPVKDMLPLEQIDANFLTICDAVGVNSNIFSNKNSTFENVKQGILQTYQDTVMPAADQRMQALSNKINYPGVRLIADYSHLEIFKENKQKGLLAVESLIRTLTQALTSGLLSLPEATLLLQNELLIQTGSDQ